MPPPPLTLHLAKCLAGVNKSQRDLLTLPLVKYLVSFSILNMTFGNKDMLGPNIKKTCAQINDQKIQLTYPQILILKIKVGL